MTKKSLIFEERKPLYGSWPVAEHRELPGRIGYLRLAEMTSDPQEVAEVLSAFEKFKDTRGLVIDVRGNGGGSRDLLRALFPYFMKPTDPLHVVNVAALRGPPAGEAKRDGELLHDRYLFTLESKSWSEAERASLVKFAAGFKPEWTPPADRFSAWHYFALKRADAPFRYEKPVVILMDTACFSATDIFLSAFKGWRNVTLMGTPSAGGSGRPLKYTLKNSGIEVRLSSIASFRRDGSLYDGRGVVPDVEIAPKSTDFLRGRLDSVLEAAVKRLGQ
jgi:C-terminal processing protease CtpA/Prc